MMRAVSFSPGSWSRPSSAGSRPSSDVRVDDAGERDPRVAALGELLERGRRTTAARTSSVSGSACSIRARLTYGSKYATSTKSAPRRYAALGDRARELLLARRSRRRRPPARAARSRRGRRARRGPGSGRPRQAIVAAARTRRGDARAGDRALPGLAAGISEATRRAYRDRPARLRRVVRRGRPARARRRARARPSTRPTSAARGPAASSRRRRSRGGSRPSARCCASRSAAASVPDDPARAAPRAPAAGRAEAGGGRRAARRRSTATARSRSATARCSSSSTRPACAAPRRSGSTSPTSTSSRSTCTSATARARRTASSRSARRRPTGSRATCARRGPSSRAAPSDALFLSARGRRLDTSTLRRLIAAPASPPPRVRDAPARGRRRPARDPGAARPLVPLDDPDLQPRRREAAPPCLRPRAPPILSATVEGVPRPARGAALAAHGRRLPPRPRRAARVPRQAGRGRAASTTSSATRRSSAPTASRPRRSRGGPRRRARFFRHLQLIGARADNPAAELALPRRTRTLPRTLSAGEAERLIDAANGVAPRALRDRALVELLYGAGLRVSEAVGAREGRRRPRRPARPRHRQGRQGAGRPDRPRGGRGAAPLPRARPPAPRPPPPAASCS